MGFAENFIAGYTKGAQARRDKEEQALKAQQFEEAKSEAADRLKLENEHLKLQQDAADTQRKIQLIALKKATPADLPDLSHSGGMGPPQEKDMPQPGSVDIMGQKIPLGSLEQTQADQLDQARALANVKDESKNITLSMDIPELGLKKGQTIAPEEATMLGHVFSGKQALAAAQIRGQGQPKVVKIMDPTTGKAQQVWAYPNGQTVPLGDAQVNATTENRAISANALISQGEDIKKMLHDPKVSANLGPAMGRYNNLKEFIGNPPPEYSKLAGEIESFALANMGVHGMRSVVGAEKIASLLTGKHTPQSLEAGIDGLLNFSHEFVKSAGMKESVPEPAPPPKPKGADEAAAYLAGVQ